MNNEGFTSSLHVFDLLIHDLIKPRKFNCVATEFHLPCRGEPRNLPNSPWNLSNFAAENCGPYSSCVHLPSSLAVPSQVKTKITLYHVCFILIYIHCAP